MHTIFAILTVIIKLTGKWTDFHQADFCERLINLQCLYYKTTDQLEKKFQDGNCVTEAKQMLGNLVYVEKKRFAIHRCGRSHGQEIAPP